MNRTSILILFVFLLNKGVPKLVDNQNRCGSKLLDDIQLVPNSAFTASSFFKHNNDGDKKMDLSPKAARESYDKDNQEFAWCPMNRVSTNLQEYLEIDLGRLVVINFAQTRGRFAQGAGKEFIPYYKLKYRREATERWRNYKKFDLSRGSTDILKGPSDAFLDAYETLDPPIVTRWIRIYPFSYTLMRVCMKLQLFGCTFESNILEYRIPQGSESTHLFPSLQGIMTTVMKLFLDSSYDGLYDQGLLNGGLGRLSDNKTGGNLILNPTESQYFVGWRIKYVPIVEDQTLTLWFRFDSVRNFSFVKLSGYENRTMQIAQPDKLEAKFSIQGQVFTDADTVVSSFPDAKSNEISNQESSWIQFNLQHKVGQFLQLKLYFRSDWIILTEIDFISEKAVGYRIQKEITFPKDKIVVTISPSISEIPPNHINSNSVVDIVYILTILLCVLVGIIVIISVFLMVMRRRRIIRKKNQKKSEIQLYSQYTIKPLNPLTSPGIGLPRVSNPHLGKYSAGVSISSQPEQCLYKHHINTQNANIALKQASQSIENNIYTSIPGSDNDSSLGTDYMASSGACSSHPYTQTIPASCSISDFIINQPQIIANPMLEFLDNQQFARPHKVTGICSYDPELLEMSSPINHNFMPSFNAVTNCYNAGEYSDPTFDTPCYPIANSFPGSSLKNNR